MMIRCNTINLKLVAFLFILSAVFYANSAAFSQEKSIARQWNELLLQGIRTDFARPVVHARNLFHLSAAMYDAWSVYEEGHRPYFLGNTRGGYFSEFNGVAIPADKLQAQQQAISYAAYRILMYRFQNSPGFSVFDIRMNTKMHDLGYDTDYTSIDYENNDPRALGNYIAYCVINYGKNDGANEENAYANLNYQPVNGPMDPTFPGSTMIDPNRWQPLSFSVFIDQSGQVSSNTPAFLGAEWGSVVPFALRNERAHMYQRKINDKEVSFKVFHDPGMPPQLGNEQTDEYYKWNFCLVAAWSSMLAKEDDIRWDISPAGFGNTSGYPENVADYADFYDLENGGQVGEGYSLNPVTGEPYTPQMVKRGDYTRVLAEFWADGPASETPPGHWFVILNYVADHPGLSRRFEGHGEELDPLEWDIKAYFILGGAMHDAAISAWGIKGWYDYVRPISAIRYMASHGQSSDPSKPSYDKRGITLIPEFIELIRPNDPLLNEPGNDLLNKIKIRAWKGPDYINDALVDEAGVGWIPARNWWPYQRPTFVTPPFAGYISGHSTFSRAAAEVLTRITGSPFFPGGVGEFHVEKNQFLKFEEGPSESFTLQWATYRDASDQTSLSRIWGGIHPPADDMPGRLIGMEIGNEAFDYAQTFFVNPSTVTGTPDQNDDHWTVFPNPVKAGKEVTLTMRYSGRELQVLVYDNQGKMIVNKRLDQPELRLPQLSGGLYLLKIQTSEGENTVRLVVTD